MDKRFWNGERWNGHRAFETVEHNHVSCYFPGEGHDSCDITVVGCADGRWYIEDNWGGDAAGAEGVWNPFDPDDTGPIFFASKHAAMLHAVAVVAKVCGIPQSEVAII